MRLTAFIMAGVLLSGAAVAEEVSKPESSLKANFRRIGLELSSTNVANAAHYQVGKAVRETIKGLGGTMPEDLPTPEKSIKELEAETRKQLKSKKD